MRKRILIAFLLATPGPAFAQVPRFEPGPEAEVAALSALDPATRLAAVGRLARFKTHDGARQALTQALIEDPDVRLRQAAATLLSRAAGKGVRQALTVASTCDPDPATRKGLAAFSRGARVRCHEQAGALPAGAALPRSEARLLTYLSHPHGHVRLKALRQLARLRSAALRRRAWDMASRDPFWSVRADALRILATSYGRKTLEVAQYALSQDPDERVRGAALEVLAYFKDPATTPWILRSMRTEPEVRMQLAGLRTLTQLPAATSEASLVELAQAHKNEALRIAALATLGAPAGRPAVQALYERLLTADRSGRVRAAVLKALSTSRTRAACVARAQRVTDEDPEVRRVVVEQLGGCDAATAVPALVTVLATERATAVRLAAARVLGAYGEPRVFEALRRAATTDSDEGVRRQAAVGAARSPSQEAWISAQLAATVDASPAVRLKAGVALCALQVPNAYRALVRLLWVDKHTPIRAAMARCFGDVDHPLVDIGLSVAHATDGDASVLRAVEGAQRQRLARLEANLARAKSGTPSQRVETVQRLHPSPNPKVRQVLEHLLFKDADARVRAAAAAVLARFADQRALQQLALAGQAEQDATTRQAILGRHAELTQRWSSARSALELNALLLQLRSTDAAARLQAAVSLGTLKDRRAWGPLQQATKAAERELRYAAVVALATFGDLAVVARAAKGEADATTRSQLIQLNYLRGASPEKLVAALGSDKVEEVRRAVEAAAIRPTERAVPWLARLALSHLDKEIREAAARALVHYEAALAHWAVRTASDHDASKGLRQSLWSLSVLAEGGNS
ncbi:MAG: HEAT repeat domain-containing protein [Deltaproteobacteria bacterium]|nr:HEAT repeat domain-containing protein [Deltaproteobacteria bacterium]